MRPSVKNLDLAGLLACGFLVGDPHQKLVISQAIVPTDQRGVITRSGPRTVQSHQRAALLVNKDTQASAPPGSNQQILPAIPIKIVRADYWPAATRAMGQSRLPSPVIERGLGVNRLRPSLPLDKLRRRPRGWLAESPVNGGSVI